MNRLRSVVVTVAVAATLVVGVVQPAAAWDGFTKTWVMPFSDGKTFWWRVSLTADEAKSIADDIGQAVDAGGGAAALMALSGNPVAVEMAPFVGGIAGVGVIAKVILNQCSDMGSQDVYIYGWSNRRGFVRGSLFDGTYRVVYEQIYVPVTCTSQ